MKVRLRPTHAPERLAALYATPHDHRLYGRGHGERVEESIRVGKLAPQRRSVADLSCGNGEIVSGIIGSIGSFAENANMVILGDYAPGYALCGPIEETLPQIPKIDLFVLCETLEHLDVPMTVLRMLGGSAGCGEAKCRYLLLSTPIDNWNDPNEEHYWAWGNEDVEHMTDLAGFTVREFSTVDSRAYGEAYCYGIWLLEARG